MRQGRHAARNSQRAGRIMRDGRADQTCKPGQRNQAADPQGCLGQGSGAPVATLDDRLVDRRHHAGRAALNRHAHHASGEKGDDDRGKRRSRHQRLVAAVAIEAATSLAILNCAARSLIA